MAAVVERERRKTAGKRMGDLVGKAQEEDDAFWGHDTWAEDDSSGNDSFRESDEESENRKDTFDSDFDDSETDNENEDAEAGEEEERELERQERENRQKKSHYVDSGKTTTGKALLIPKVKGIKATGKRLIGNGINAGIVLNVPLPAAAVGSSSAVPLAPLAQIPMESSAAMAPPTPATTSSPTSPNKRIRMTAEIGVRTSTLASGRERRSQTRKRDSRNSAPTYSDNPTAQQQPSSSNKRLKTQTGATRKSKRRQYTQEELLLEAVEDTEPENQRWLLARKRVQDSADQDKDAVSAMRDKHRGKNVIQRYHSRRGCLVKLTFPEMDAVPELLTRKHEPPATPKKIVCVITGKPARYRDPKTNQGYYDTAAFKELRRRHEAGLPLDQGPISKPKPKPKQSTPKKEKVTLSGSTPATTLAGAVHPKSPSSNGYFVDLGGAHKSPGSTRTSGRKWKPSEKMIQGSGLEREGEAKSGNSPLPHSEPLAAAVLASAPPLPSMAISAKLETAESNATMEESSSNTNIGTNGSARTEKKKTPSFKTTTPSGTGQTETKCPTDTMAASNPEGKSPDPKSPQKEPLYVIPSDKDNGITEPRYVTQSELIMQVITNYSSRANEEHGAGVSNNANVNQLANGE